MHDSLLAGEYYHKFADLQKKSAKPWGRSGIL
jgi:hypothetical protein